MAFFPDGHRAATAGRDKLVHVWDLDTGRELAAWEGHDNTITSLAISRDGSRIVTGSFDATVILWDVERGTIVHRFEMPPDDTGAEVAFDSDGNIVAAGNGTEVTRPEPGNLIVWDANSPFAVVHRDERPFARHMAVAALPGGRVLTGDRYALRLWTPRQSGAGASQLPAPTNRGTSPVNLLKLIQPQTYKIGDWQMRRGVLISPTTGGARLEIPYSPPLEYRLDMIVEHVATKEVSYAFALGSVISGRQIEIGIDHVVHPFGKCTGLAGLDGAPVEAGPRFHRGQLLFRNRPARLSFTVRRDSISVMCDGSQVFNWKGETKRFIPYHRWKIPDPTKLFLASASSVKFHEMILTPLTASSP